MTTKQVILHTGFHKNASSSIQHSLAKNRKLLQAKGYCYPEMTLAAGKRFYNQSIPLYGLFTNKPQSFRHYWYHNDLDYRVANEIISQHLDSVLNQDQTLIFSDEFISRLSGENLIKVKSYFEENNYEIRVISFVREPFKLIVSSAQQMAKAKTIEESICRDIANLDALKIRTLKNVFGDNAEFYSFERACEHETGPVGFFFNLIGIALSSEQTERINEGMSMQAARLASYINSCCPLFLTVSELNPLRNPNDLVPIYSIKGDSFSLSTDEIEIIKPRVIKARENISQILGCDFLPDAELPEGSDHVRWSAQQLQELVDISPQLNLNLLLRIHDYFSTHNELVFNSEDLSQFTAIISGRLQGELESLNAQLSTRHRLMSIIKKKFFA
ncbi:MAG: hypothetical protein JJU48_10690 [Methylophaga sp.]|nr:hypothetical protein [Methylophaga sp.]